MAEPGAEPVGPVAEPAHQDPGLQPERTVLSWHRTCLTLLIFGVLLGRWGLTSDTAEASPVLAGGMTALFALVLVLVVSIAVTQGRRYRHQSAGITAEEVAPGVGMHILLTLAVMLVGVGALGMVWLTS